MEFCKICKGLLLVKEDGVFCKNCGEKHEFFELISKELVSNTKEISLIEEKDDSTLPKIYNKCSKCNYSQAYFWHMNSVGDEAEVVYYKCVKCNYTTQKGGQRGGR